MRIPKTLGGQIDKLYELREERLALQRQADALKEQEAALGSVVLTHLASERADKASGKLATASRRLVVVGKVADWVAFYGYVKKNDAFDLLQRRVNDSAFRERLDTGERVSGVDAETVISLSLTKASR